MSEEFGGDINNSPEEQSETQPEMQQEKKRRFGRGIYAKTDVPIKMLDRFIAFIIVAIVLLIAVFAINGGYTIFFDTQGGTEISSQKLKYGDYVTEPELPIKPGYEFGGWYYEQDSENNWDFTVNKVGGDMTLIARWIAAPVTVKFELDGGTLEGEKESIQVIYQEPYGELPTPVKDGYVFDGWNYSGSKITNDTIVMMPGEHVLTALWK